MFFLTSILSSYNRVVHPPSGRVVDLYTTEPGVQFYTAFYLDGQVGKGGIVYRKNGAFTLEAQHYPNSPNEVMQGGFRGLMCHFHGKFWINLGYRFYLN